MFRSHSCDSQPVNTASVSAVPILQLRSLHIDMLHNLVAVLSVYLESFTNCHLTRALDTHGSPLSVCHRGPFGPDHSLPNHLFCYCLFAACSDVRQTWHM